MSDRKLTPNFRRRNFATASMSLQSQATEGDEEEEDQRQQKDRRRLFTADRFQSTVSIPMQSSSSFDLPIGDSGSRELLQDDELMSATTRMISMDGGAADEEEEALDNFEMGTPNESKNDLEILSPIKLSMLSTQLLSTTAESRAGPGNSSGNVYASSMKSGPRGVSECSDRRRVDERPRKVVEFANFEDNDYSRQKQQRTDSTGDAVQAKIFAEIKK